VVVKSEKQAKGAVASLLARPLLGRIDNGVIRVLKCLKTSVASVVSQGYDGGAECGFKTLAVDIIKG